MAAYEVLLLNTAIPQIQAAQSGDTYVVPRDIAINASASITGNLGIGTSAAAKLDVLGPSADQIRVRTAGTEFYRFGRNASTGFLDFYGSQTGYQGYTFGGVDGTWATINASGNLGIGTSSITDKLTAQGTIRATDGTNYAQFANNFLRSYASGTFYFDNATVGQSFVYRVSGASSLDTTALTLNSSGNLGLGVTPSAWSSMRAFQNGTATFANDTGAPRGRLITNAVYNGSNYLFLDASSNYALNYTQDGATGAHQWRTSTAAGTSPNIATLSDLMTLHASGGLSVGNTNDPSGGSVNIGVGAVNSNNYLLRISAGTSGLSRIIAADTSDSGYIDYNHSIDAWQFYTSGTERARITSGGYFKASNNGTYNNSTATYHEFYNSQDNPALLLRCVNATQGSDAFNVIVDRNTTNNSFYALSYYNSGAAAYKFRVADSGDVTNTNGTYGTISDAKMKTDIVDAGSQWADIKALRFRKFKMKNDPSGLVQLGVVAQEVELTSPGLVGEHADRDAEGNDLGTTTKSVKTSVLLMKAAVALQEAMARIEQLEAKVAAMGA